MDRWIGAALDYLPSWLDYQMLSWRQPGCLLAVVHRGQVVLERAFGSANLATGEPLTPRHRFRIASHSKSFTSAGVMRLREQGKLRLDDPVGKYVSGLNKKTGQVTISQLLSHSAGIVRDGADSSQFDLSRPFPDSKRLLADLASGPVIDPGLRLKYSNHGYSLLGLAIAAITGERYEKWIEREVVAAAGLKETTADVPLRPRGAKLALGHSMHHLIGRRLVLPGNYPLNAIAPAGGFVATAADTALFFNQLSPAARRSILSPGSRREMVRRHWRNPHTSLEGYYGLGIMSGTINGWNWFGHSGGLLGYISRTITLPDSNLTVSIMTNALDGWAGVWAEGAVNILRTFATNGPASRRLKGWTGRWWSSWGAVDLVPMRDKVMVAGPYMANHPFFDASEIAVTGRDRGRIAQAAGYANYGEPVRFKRNAAGRAIEFWLGSSRFVSRARTVADLTRRFPRREKGSR
jgi:CubicO group peptidase (beta-lactamase class C family)